MSVTYGAGGTTRDRTHNCVKKIIEEHGGEFYLEDALRVNNDNHYGARARIKFLKSELE